jgi:hypothetical protein
MHTICIFSIHYAQNTLLTMLGELDFCKPPPDLFFPPPPPLDHGFSDGLSIMAFRDGFLHRSREAIEATWLLIVNCIVRSEEAEKAHVPPQPASPSEDLTMPQ